MDESKRLELEKSELNAIISRGIDFEIIDKEISYNRKLFGLLRKKSIRNVVRKYHISEPTLATLDRISAEAIEFAIDENAMKSTEGVKIVMGLAAKHCKRCARIIAIAVLGEDLYKPKQHGNICIYKEDSKKLEALTQTFFRTIQPSQLYQIYIAIQTMGNLGDFANSIRLMSTDRTTMPIRIEE